MPQQIVYREIDPAVTTDGAGNLRLVLNVAAVWAAIENILLTIPGERVYRRGFGANIKSQLFERMTTGVKNYFTNTLKTMVAQWDSRVNITSIDYVARPDDHEIDLTIRVQIAGLENDAINTLTLRE